MFNKTLINFRPFFFAAICIALGIGTGYLFYYGQDMWGGLLALIFFIFTAFTVLFSGGEIKAKLIFALIFLLVYAFGITTFLVQVTDYDNANLQGHYYTVNGKVTDVYQTKDGQRLTLESVSIKGNRTGKLRYGINVYVMSGDKQFGVGDLVEFQGYLQDINSIYEDRLSATNIERKIKYTAMLDGAEIVKTGSNLTLFERVNLHIRNSINNGMDEREAAVAIGLLLGSTEEMESELLTSYRSAGVAHIFAVSGLHIGFLATALNYVFNKLRVNRVVKAILITLALVFYSGVCGFSASSLRASVMSAVLLFSSVKGNRYDGLSSVGVAGLLLLACSPIHMFCVGFQLSFVVALGMLLLSKPFSKLLSFLPERLASSLGAVMSAQVVGIPICIYSFEQFSTISILANLVFLPVIGVIFILVFLSAIIGIFGISQVVLFLPNYLFKAINFLISAIDYEWFIISGVTFGAFVILYYLAFVISCGIINLKKPIKIVTTLVCVIACVIGSVVTSVQEIAMPKAFVIGDENVCATIIKNGEEKVMIISQAKRNFSTSRFVRLSEREGITDIDAVIFTQIDTDILPVITKLGQVFTLDKICYYGLTDTDTEQIIRKSFGLNVRSFNDKDKLNVQTDCAYALNGRAVECSVNGCELAIISQLDKTYPEYKGLDGQYDYMIATDYVGFIYEHYKPSEFISYKDSLGFKNALSSGTVSLNLK